MNLKEGFQKAVTYTALAALPFMPNLVKGADIQNNDLFPEGVDTPVDLSATTASTFGLVDNAMSQESTEQVTSNPPSLADMALVDKLIDTDASTIWKCKRNNAKDSYEFSITNTKGETRKVVVKRTGADSFEIENPTKEGQLLWNTVQFINNENHGGETSEEVSDLDLKEKIALVDAWKTAVDAATKSFVDAEDDLETNKKALDTAKKRLDQIDEEIYHLDNNVVNRKGNKSKQIKESQLLTQQKEDLVKAVDGAREKLTVAQGALEVAQENLDKKTEEKKSTANAEIVLEKAQETFDKAKTAFDAARDAQVAGPPPMEGSIGDKIQSGKEKIDELKEEKLFQENEVESAELYMGLYEQQLAEVKKNLDDIKTAKPNLK